LYPSCRIFFPSFKNIASVESIIQQEPSEEFNAWYTFGFPYPTDRLRSDDAGEVMMVVPVSRVVILPPYECPMIIFLRGIND
jgi:hypothetical protein